MIATTDLLKGYDELVTQLNEREIAEKAFVEKIIREYRQLPSVDRTMHDMRKIKEALESRGFVMNDPKQKRFVLMIDIREKKREGNFEFLDALVFNNRGNIL